MTTYVAWDINNYISDYGYNTFGGNPSWFSTTYHTHDTAALGFTSTPFNNSWVISNGGLNSGKIYFEFKLIAGGYTVGIVQGLCDTTLQSSLSSYVSTATSNFLGMDIHGVGICYNYGAPANDPYITYGTSPAISNGTSLGPPFPNTVTSQTFIIGVAIDFTAGKLWFSVDYNFGGNSYYAWVGNGDPANGTNPVLNFSLDPGQSLWPAISQLYTNQGSTICLNSDPAHMTHLAPNGFTRGFPFISNSITGTISQSLKKPLQSLAALDGSWNRRYYSWMKDANR